jgi:hypothetical protein
MLIKSIKGARKLSKTALTKLDLETINSLVPADINNKNNHDDEG